MATIISAIFAGLALRTKSYSHWTHFLSVLTVPHWAFFMVCHRFSPSRLFLKPNFLQHWETVSSRSGQDSFREFSLRRILKPSSDSSSPKAPESNLASMDPEVLLLWRRFDLCQVQEKYSCSMLRHSSPFSGLSDKLSQSSSFHYLTNLLKAHCAAGKGGNLPPVSFLQSSEYLVPWPNG